MSANQSFAKIPLSKQDLHYLFNQMRRQMTSKLDYHVPGSGPRDLLKLEVEKQLNRFLIETFELAKAGMIIDGIDIYEENIPIEDLLSLNTEDEVEPFNMELNNELRAVIGEVEKETTLLTDLRRELPSKAKDEYRELISKTDMAVTMALTDLDNECDEIMKKEASVDGGEENFIDLKPFIPNLDEIIKDYQQSLLLLSNSKISIPERKAELDTLNEAVTFLESTYLKQQNEMDGF